MINTPSQCLENNNGKCNTRSPIFREVRGLTKEAIEGGLDALREYMQEGPHRMTMTTEAVRQALGTWGAGGWAKLGIRAGVAAGKRPMRTSRA
jgi:hypothetical protein